MNEDNETLEAQEPDMSELWDGEETGEQTSDPESVEETTEAPEQTEEPGRGDGEPATEAQTSAGAQQAETFTLKHLDDPPMTVGREEVVRLAQQGLDYERVRTERDGLRAYRDQAGPVLELVRGFAQRSGMTVEQYVDHCRTQELMSQGVNEATAQAQVEVEKQRSAVEAQTRAAQAEQQRRETAAAQAKQQVEARRKDMEGFLAAYPEVKAEEVPPEVWQRVAAGESLVGAYTMYQNKQLKAQIAAREQNRQNAARAPGSMGTQEQTGRKSLADYWDEAGE